MADSMVFPNDWAKFLDDYSFKDHKEFYTNGARLIPTFRVEQMMHHYLRKATEDAVKHGRWVEKYHENPLGGFFQFHCSECAASKPVAITTNFCPNCGAKMDL